ncbi:MAG: homocysteine S-methyltransferase family protein [Treponema sp.]|jgi:5-methyltetrahydrofolate--homocysteine methyltransferase|nr:homocysteine S-methyltransferase family protein [Treponema sp.]
MNIREQLNALAAERILVLDGAMGSMIQTFHLEEQDFRGERFSAHPNSLNGCNDLLCLTRPDIIRSIHEAYLRAGADIIETCSFNANRISLSDFGIGDLAYEISAAAASLARKAADSFSTQQKPRFVAGSMGPTAKSASLSPDINNPAKRSVTWDELEEAYYQNACGLLDGGAQILLIETVFDTLNAKAALAAIGRLLDERRARQPDARNYFDIPVMISATVSDNSGRLLAGQTLHAFCISMLHAKPWSIGLNCSFGAEKLKSSLMEIAGFTPCFTSAHPNGGMPNHLGIYDQTPENMAFYIKEYLQEGLVNIIGGCCGTTPDHITAIAELVPHYKPRKVPRKDAVMYLAGLEPFYLNPNSTKWGFVPIGERGNVAGSRKFLRLIKEEEYDDAVSILDDEIEKGAAIIDLCMDNALLDPVKAVKNFLGLALSYPAVACVPIMLDSSRWDVIETGLKLIQGKPLINSISLKEGEIPFLQKAGLARRYGAAVVVMLFDEKGQAASYERKIEIAGRSYKLLTENGFPPEDIVFDPNILTIATGIAEHDSYALDFIRACSWIRENCACVQISGGISNLSFSFRGNNQIREAIHAVFLKHAVAAGLNMAIVNPATIFPYNEVDPLLRETIENVILCRNLEESSERLLALATDLNDEVKKKSQG